MRGALIGAAVAGFFGGAWALWGAGGLPGAAGVAVRIAGVLLGAAVVVAALVLARRGGADGGADGGSTLFGSRAYRLIVLAEVVALFGGNVVLNAFGLGTYVVVWTSFVVGVHFLAFGRVFDPVFTAIGAAMVVAAGLGLVAGLVTGSASAVLAVTALISAVVLLAAGARTILAAARVPR